METVVSADGTTIAYERSGAGPALVVVPGAVNGRHVAAAIPGARLSSMDGQTHQVAQDALAAALLEFFGPISPDGPAG